MIISGEEMSVCEVLYKVNEHRKQIVKHGESANDVAHPHSIKHALFEEKKRIMQNGTEGIRGRHAFSF